VLPLFPSELGKSSCDLLRVRIPILEAREHHSSLLCIKERKVKSELRAKEHTREIRNSLRVFLENKKVEGHQEKVIFKIR